VGIANPPKFDWHPQGEPGVIRFLSYRPGQRQIGTALLEAAEKWARERGRGEIFGWNSLYAYPFYHLFHANLSDRLGHLHSLFGKAGYQPDWGEVFFDWTGFVPPAVPMPALNFDLEVERQEKPEHERNQTVVKALHNGEEIGRCIMLRLGEVLPRPDGREWSFCDWLGVNEPLQGRGLGKFLLAQSLVEMQRAGCKHAAISTSHQNYRAYLFYTNFGFNFCDRTTSFRKQLENLALTAEDAETCPEPAEGAQRRIFGWPPEPSAPLFRWAGP